MVSQWIKEITSSVFALDLFVVFQLAYEQSFLDEEREIVFVFDKDDADAANEEKPKEHSPENHMYYHTYHFKDNLETITELQVREKVLEVIRNVCRE